MTPWNKGRATDPIWRVPGKFSVDAVGCMVWTGATTVNRPGNEYASLWVDGKMRRAQRIVCEAVYGKIPDGLMVDHLCNNKLCINPAHLDVVTNRENLLRGWDRRGPMRLCKRGHPQVPGNLYHYEVAGRARQRCRLCRMMARPGWQR